MNAKGSFEINMMPQEDGEASVGRFLIDKTYTAGLQGKGIGQMISKRLENGTAVYFAIEEFSGQVDGKRGAFTFLHKGHMDSESQSLEITILAGSGSEELTSISGSLTITQIDGTHSYEFDYDV